MIRGMWRGSLRRRPGQLGLVAAAVAVAAMAAAIFGSFSERSRDRFAEDLRGFGPNLLVRPQVGGPQHLASGEAARIAALPGVEAVAPIAELEEQGRLVIAATPALLVLHPRWRLEGRWPETREVALGAVAAPVEAPVSGRVLTGDRLDGAIFRPLGDIESPAGAQVGAVVDRFEVRAAPERLEALALEVRGTVAGAEAVPIGRVRAADERLTGKLRLLLLTAGALSLALGLLAVAAATAALLGERRAEIGLLLALGYSGPRVAGVHVLELMAAGGLGAVAGLVAGELVAAGLVARLHGPPDAAALWTAGGSLGAAAAGIVVVGAGALVVAQRLTRLDAAELLRGD